MQTWRTLDSLESARVATSVATSKTETFALAPTVLRSLIRTAGSNPTESERTACKWAVAQNW